MHVLIIFLLKLFSFNQFRVVTIHILYVLLFWYHVM